MTIEISPFEQQILIDSMRERIGKLYRMSEAYAFVGKKEAQMDCLDEKKKVENLLEYINSK